MEFGEKLSKLRKENHYTQEQLASLLEVSRQSVSKWESGAAYPETEKLIRLSKLFHCSLDYLLKEEMEQPVQPAPGQPFTIRKLYFERKSERMVGNLPLYHINIGFGRVAKGVFAFGLLSKGIVSVGLLSMGLASFGVLSLGLLSLGVFALGLVAAGSIAAGVVSLGAIAVGVVSLGALAIGIFPTGALSIGIDGVKRAVPITKIWW